MTKRSKKGYFKRYNFRRRENVRPPLKRVLVVCEGESTEPNYFRGLRNFLKGEIVLEIAGIGANTRFVVERAIEIRKCSEFEEVWVVFDKDIFSEDHFNAAVDIAKGKGLRVAYSVPCFELWFLLHFKFIDRSLDHNEVRQMLNKEFRSIWGKDYKKTDVDLWNLLYGRIDNAIKNAEKINNMWNDTRYAKHNPSTLVVDLIKAVYLPYAAKLQNH